MPNHVTNRIKITGDRADVLRFFTQGKAGAEDDESFSFAGFIPPPDDPVYSSGGCSHDHYKYQLGREEGPDPHANCWYPWNTANWGTKWGAYSTHVNKPFNLLDALACDGIVTGEVRFDTAWSPPMPVFEKIIDLFPNCEFEIVYLDEDSTGSGGGLIRAENGEVTDHITGVNDPDSPEHGELWWELATELHGYTKEIHDERMAEIAEDERLAAAEGE